MEVLLLHSRGMAHRGSEFSNHCFSTLSSVFQARSKCHLPVFLGLDTFNRGVPISFAIHVQPPLAGAHVRETHALRDPLHWGVHLSMSPHPIRPAQLTH